MPDDSPQFATLERDGWELESGEARNAAFPDTFPIPPRGEREALEVGAHVKLMFNIGKTDAGFERMWVLVESTLPGAYVGEPVYVGALRSKPVTAHDALAWGCRVVFGPEHVIQFE